jgi:hypothetical protein
MREPAARRGSSLCSILLACLGALFTAAGPASAQVSPSVEVYLVRQDSSDCTNSTVSNADSPQVSGEIVVVRNSDGTTSVKVAMTASPNTTYHFYLKCVRQIGDVVTGDESVGIQVFSFPTNLTGNVFAFDGYPDGAPSGNKFQSVQVVFKY